MPTEAIILAWKSEEFRESLNSFELSMVPDNPAGLIELIDEEAENYIRGVIPPPRPSVTCASQCTCRSCFTCQGCIPF